MLISLRARISTRALPLLALLAAGAMPSVAWASDADTAAQAAAKAFIRATSRMFGRTPPAAPQPSPRGLPEPTLGLAFSLTPLGAQVIAVMPKSPAEAAGIVPGRIITSVNGVALAGAAMDSATAVLRAPARPMVLGLADGGRVSLPRLAPAPVQPPARAPAPPADEDE